MKKPRRLLRGFRPRGPSTVDLLREQVDHALRALAIIESVLEDRLSTSEGAAEVIRAEHGGDRAREKLIAELVSALVPPLDREDLFRASRSVDDVLDNLRDFMRELDLFSVRADRQRYLPLVAAIRSTLELLGRAIEEIARSVTDFPHTVLAAKKASNRIRRRYDEALADLLVGEVDTRMLMARELLRRLDIVGLQVGDAADALADGAVKRNH